MLYIVGLGLGDEKDITVKGLEAPESVKSRERICLEHIDPEALHGKKILLADREMVESDLNAILKDADWINVAFLVVGDPYGSAATTHTDLVLRAKELDIRVTSIHNASIVSAIGCCGLQLYNHGQTISIVFFSDNWRPDSFCDKIKQNRAIKLHTLCLLDIKVKEHMSRIGTPDQRIICGTLQELLEADFGEPLHSLVLAGEMHFLEADILKTFAINVDTFNQYAQVSDH
ncbi:tetrapyrrole methylase [Chytriomyces cf. hyalinus JEL632]|nr:tetrapyrrole methylase [Chytriomyces cf. hyalinus JEL632]